MANYFTQPMKMESQYVDTKLFNVFYQENDVDTAVKDGTLVVLGKFASDPVYAAAYAAAGQAALAPTDFNARYAALPTPTSTDVCIIDLANVPTATSDGTGSNPRTYRIGIPTIGLTLAAGVPARARKLVKDDTFCIGEGNCTSALTKGQYATVDATGKFAPAATAPTTDGAYFYVMDKYSVTQGVTADVTAYRLCVESN